MMLTIKSRKIGQSFTFRMPDTGGYITLGITGQQLRQPCKGGVFFGSTLMATPDTFEAECRRWYRAYMRGTD